MQWVTLNDMAGKSRIVNLAQITQIVAEPNQYRVYLVSIEPFAIGKDQFQKLQAEIAKAGSSN